MQKYSVNVYQDEMLDESPVVMMETIKKGDVFYECEHGVNIKLEALSDAIPTNEGWLCRVKSAYGITNIYSSAATVLYGPSLYKEPFFSTVDDQNKPIFPIE